MDTLDLRHHFLIAMPGMDDPHFRGTLTYICDHGREGALGIVVNRPTKLKLAELFEQVGLPLPEGLRAQTVYYGGPVHPERGFVLHSPPLVYNSTLSVEGAVHLTTSKDILEAMSQGAGPDRFLVSVGYAGWGPGQLEEEMKANAWLTVAADPEVIFGLASEERLPAAASRLGIDLARLSDVAGHA